MFVYPSYPVWLHYSVTYSDFKNLAVKTGTKILLTIPAMVGVAGIIAKHSVAFVDGGTITKCVASVGTAANASQYVNAFNVFQAPGDTVFAASLPTLGVPFSWVNPTDIIATVVSTGGNLSGLTSGWLDIWVQCSGLMSNA